jgi:hypothetical protein
MNCPQSSWSMSAPHQLAFKSQQTRLLWLALSFPALEWAISSNEFISKMSLELLLNFGPLSCNYTEQQCCWEREVKLGLICAALAPLVPSWTASYSIHWIGKSSWKVVSEVFLSMTGPECNVISWPQKFVYVKPISSRSSPDNVNGRSSVQFSLNTGIWHTRLTIIQLGIRALCPQNTLSLLNDGGRSPLRDCPLPVYLTWPCTFSDRRMNNTICNHSDFNFFSVANVLCVMS